jgi:hypothetical protein
MNLKHVPSYLVTAAVIYANYLYFSSSCKNGCLNRPDNTGFIVIAVLLLGLLLLTIGAFFYHLLAAEKGDIEIEFPQRVYAPGEQLEGCLRVNLHKAQDFNSVTITLYAEATRSRKDTSSRRMVVWQEEQNLLAKQMLSSGRHQYIFSFTFPESERSIDLTRSNIILRLIYEALSGNKRWFLRARFDAPGVDLVSYAKVRVNEGQLFY